LSERVALDGSGVVAALRRWGLPSRKYKRKENLAARKELIAQFLSETAEWLKVGEAEIDLCVSSDDAFDALIAALVARAAAVGLVELISEDDRAAAMREGWIAVPTENSLSLLALG